MKRTLVIGDIHGGLRALLQVMERAAVTIEDTLVFLGDYVDGWSDAAAVLEYAIQLAGKQPCVFIKGNHDVWCEDWLRTGQSDKTWLVHGGQATTKSYALVTEATRKQHLHFLEEMDLYAVDAKNRLFIHAGFTSVHGPEKEFHSSSFSWDRSLWEMAIKLQKGIEKDTAQLPRILRLYHEIYIGHTPTLYYDEMVPMQGGNVWNIDTGAAFTGRLSILDVDTKTFWQSDIVQDLYPGETGRNNS